MEKLLSVADNRVFESEIVVNKSRFLCFVKYVSDEESANAFLAQIRKKYKDARHICYAFRLQNLGKLSDDGEPSGTAGLPIMGVLKKQGLYNIIAVVVRYFGGIKLGAGGLLRAYTDAVSMCIESAKKVIWERAFICEKSMDYSEYNTFLSRIKNHKIKILDTDFSLAPSVKFVVSKDEEIRNFNIVGECLFSFEQEE